MNVSKQICIFAKHFQNIYFNRVSTSSQTLGLKACATMPSQVPTFYTNTKRHHYQKVTFTKKIKAWQCAINGLNMLVLNKSIKYFY